MLHVEAIAAIGLGLFLAFLEADLAPIFPWLLTEVLRAILFFVLRSGTLRVEDSPQGGAIPTLDVGQSEAGNWLVDR